MYAFKKTIDLDSYYKRVEVNVESYDHGKEIVDMSNTRTRTDSRFEDYRAEYRFGDDGWSGIGSFADAERLLVEGYDAAVKKLKSYDSASNLRGVGKRTQFKNDLVGFAPIVPLALQGVPLNMINSYAKPIKNKVLNVYYDVAVSAGYEPEQILEAGRKFLTMLMKLEMQGYRFNVYCTQAYSRLSDCKHIDLLKLKVKDAGRPLDIKRISFPLVHSGFLRAIGFDWYSRVPGGK